MNLTSIFFFGNEFFIIIVVFIIMPYIYNAFQILNEKIVWYKSNSFLKVIKNLKRIEW